MSESLTTEEEISISNITAEGTVTHTAEHDTIQAAAIPYHTMVNRALNMLPVMAPNRQLLMLLVECLRALSSVHYC